MSDKERYLVQLLWLFLVAPFIGAVIAAVFWKYLFEDTGSPA